MCFIRSLTLGALFYKLNNNNVMNKIRKYKNSQTGLFSNGLCTYGTRHI